MRPVATLIASILMVIGLSDEARSDFNLCNHTPLWLDANLTYGVRDDYRSIGAPRLLLPGECKTLIRGPVRLSSEYYVAAHPASGVYEQAFDWRMPTDYSLCNVDGRKIFFKSEEPQPCADRFLTFADWHRILPDVDDFPFALISKESFTLDQARAAGAQQFLNLLGFDVGPVDGIIGARTDRGLRRYQKDFGLRADGPLTAELVEGMGLALRQAYASREIILQSPKR
jgi:uncharacterized membrane protein